MPLVWNAVFLGVREDVDTNENTNALENGQSLVGTYGGNGAELSGQVARFTINDVDGDNRWDRDNEAQPERSSYEMDGETHAATLDSIGVYRAEVSFTDGTTGNISAVIMQLNDGSVFLAPEFSNNADHNLLESGEIESLTLIEPLFENAVLVANRQDTDFVVCFDANSRIVTASGLRRAGDLAVGDLICTKDNGDQRIRWISRREVLAKGNAAPIAFARDAIGEHRPFRVSPQHKMLMTGWRAELLFGVPEILVPAIALVNDKTIRQEEGGTVEYVHFLFDKHEIIYVEGVPSESLHLGVSAASCFDAPELIEALSLFPDVAFFSALARPAATVREGRALASMS